MIAAVPHACGESFFEYQLTDEFLFTHEIITKQPTLKGGRFCYVVVTGQISNNQQSPELRCLAHPTNALPKAVGYALGAINLTITAF